jgi:isoleucyl-tRNA synthetase
MQISQPIIVFQRKSKENYKNVVTHKILSTNRGCKMSFLIENTILMHQRYVNTIIIA